MNFLFTTEMVLSNKVVIKGIKMVIRNYAITPRRGIAQSAQGIAMGNRRCRLRPVRAKVSLGNLCPFRANVTLPSTQGEALGRAFVDLSVFFGSMRTIIFFLLGSFFFFLALHHPFQYLSRFCRDKPIPPIVPCVKKLPVAVSIAQRRTKMPRQPKSHRDRGFSPP